MNNLPTFWIKVNLCIRSHPILPIQIHYFSIILSLLYHPFSFPSESFPFFLYRREKTFTRPHYPSADTAPFLGFPWKQYSSKELFILSAICLFSFSLTFNPSRLIPKQLISMIPMFANSNSQFSVLILFDITTAFYTIYHSFLWETLV